MLEDLKPEIQTEVLEFLGLKDAKEGNYDVIPLFMLAESEGEVGKFSKEDQIIVIARVFYDNRQAGKIELSDNQKRPLLFFYNMRNLFFIGKARDLLPFLAKAKADKSIIGYANGKIIYQN